jgi:hypothetical protein
MATACHLAFPVVLGIAVALTQGQLCCPSGTLGKVCRHFWCQTATPAPGLVGPGWDASPFPTVPSMLPPENHLSPNATKAATETQLQQIKESDNGHSGDSSGPHEHKRGQHWINTRPTRLTQQLQGHKAAEE